MSGRPTPHRPPWRIGLIGAGMVSRHHLDAWARIPEARVVAIADPDQARAEARARAYDIGAAYGTAEALLAEQACDAIDIAAPVGAHGALCRLVAERGLPILCQKPLAATHDEAAAIVAAVAGRVRFMVHENWRFRACYRQVKAWLDAGLVGQVEEVRLSVVSRGLIADEGGGYPALERQPFLADLPRLLVFEVLIHHIDVLRWLCGALSVTDVALSRSCPAVRGEDTASIRLATRDGVAVQLDGSLTEPTAPLPVSDRLTIIGSAGAIRLQDARLTLEGAHAEQAQAKQVQWDFDTLYRSAFEGALSHFVDGLAYDRPFETEARDNLAVLRLVEEVYAAGDTGAALPDGT